MWMAVCIPVVAYVLWLMSHACSVCSSMYSQYCLFWLNSYKLHLNSVFNVFLNPVCSPVLYYALCTYYTYISICFSILSPDLYILALAPIISE